MVWADSPHPEHHTVKEKVTATNEFNISVNHLFIWSQKSTAPFFVSFTPSSVLLPHNPFLPPSNHPIS